MLGVDCGSATTGIGVVETQGRTCRLLHFGAIRPPRSQEFPDRLAHIHRELERLVQEFRPDAIALEQIFQAHNVKTAMQLSQVRGAVLLAASRAGVRVVEYSALTVKKSVVGYGRAEKHQVQWMVQRELGLASPPQPDDVADALAVAICHWRAETAQRRLKAGANG